MTTRVAPQLIDQTNGIGYTTGVGGTQTQQTSKATTVTLNAPCGRITMHNQSLNAGASTSFFVSNSFVGVNDVVMVNGATDGFNFDNYEIRCIQVYAGTFKVFVKNISGGALAEAIPINFAVIKGVTS